MTGLYMNEVEYVKQMKPFKCAHNKEAVLKHLAKLKIHRKTENFQPKNQPEGEHWTELIKIQIHALL